MTSPKAIAFPLKTKFILGIVMLVALIIILSSVNTSIRESDLLTESMDQGGILLSSTLALACQDPIIRQAYDELVPYTERIIAAGDDIKEISIFDQDGKYLAHRKRGEGNDKLGEVLAEPEKERYLAPEKAKRLSLDENTVEYIAPVQVGNSRLGVVLLRYSFDRLADSKSTSRRQIFIIGMIALLGGIILSVILAQFIISGLDSLMKGTQIVSTGDLSYRLSIYSNDEIGMLAGRFNEMIQSLETNRKALDRKMFEIETLFKASQAMNFQNDTDKLVRQILEMASKALTAERSSIMLLADQTDELCTKVVYGTGEADGKSDGKPARMETRIKSGEGVAGTVLKTGRSLIVNEGHKDPLFKSYDTTAPFEQSIRNIISVPLLVKERVTGVINVVNKGDPAGFNADDQRLLEALGHQAAMAVEHARLYELAITDGLTRLFIHRYFQARLEEEIVRARRYHSMVSLILFDIDHFKKFNDTYGHQQGDIVLTEVAKLIKLTIRDTIDIPARYGGEEFTLILPETDTPGAQLVAERLRQTVESFQFPGQGEPLRVTISLGIATFPLHANSRPALIKNADIALYNCKKSGRNCSTVYSTALGEKV